MPSPEIINEPANVTTQIFSKFIEELVNAGISSDLIERFRKTLLEDKAYSERSLKSAFIGEEQPR